MSKDEIQHVTAEVLEAPAPRVLSKAEKRQEQLRTIEDDMLSDGLNLVSGAIDITALDPDNPELMPEGWKELYGIAGAKKRLRAATYGLMSAKEAPIALKMATQIVTGIIKARAAEKAGTRSLNIGQAVFIGQRVKYDELEVED